jgi:hypothetical protein
MKTFNSGRTNMSGPTGASPYPEPNVAKVRQKKWSIFPMPRKTISNQDHNVNRNDEQKTDNKEEVKPEESPKENKRWHDAKHRQVER